MDVSGRARREDHQEERRPAPSRARGGACRRPRHRGCRGGRRAVRGCRRHSTMPETVVRTADPLAQVPPTVDVLREVIDDTGGHRTDTLTGLTVCPERPHVQGGTGSWAASLAQHTRRVRGRVCHPSADARDARPTATAATRRAPRPPLRARLRDRRDAAHPSPRSREHPHARPDPRRRLHSQPHAVAADRRRAAPQPPGLSRGADRDPPPVTRVPAPPHTGGGSQSARGGAASPPRRYQRLDR